MRRTAIVLALAAGCSPTDDSTAPWDAAATADVSVPEAQVDSYAEPSPAEAGVDAAAADAPPDAAQEPDSADAPAPCSKEGGRACAGGEIPGEPNSLCVCKNGFWTLDHACGAPCEPMPKGVPDRCPSDLTVPASLLKALQGTPYVEQDCGPGTYDGWPYAARKCTYSAGGITTTVTVANPSPEQVAAWIVDASTFIPALWNLKWISPSHYADGVIEIAASSDESVGGRRHG
jgi:hypothetical protein